jgi:hypothetical protein
MSRNHCNDVLMFLQLLLMLLLLQLLLMLLLLHLLLLLLLLLLQLLRFLLQSLLLLSPFAGWATAAAVRVSLAAAAPQSLPAPA